MGKRKERPTLKLGGHFMMIGGECVAIDPLQTDLPERCKLVWAEAMTGNKYELGGGCHRETGSHERSTLKSG